MKSHYVLLFKPLALASSFPKHPCPCESIIFLYHLAISSISIRYRTPHTSLRRDTLRAPLEHGPEARLSFSTWCGLKEPLPPLHRDAHRDPHQGREPPRLRYLVILYLRPQRPRGFHIPRMEQPLVHSHLLLSADTRREDHLLPQGRLLRTPRVQYGALWARGPRL